MRFSCGVLALFFAFFITLTASQLIRVRDNRVDDETIKAEADPESLEKNTCPRWDDYYHMKGNPNCWHNPDFNLDTNGFAHKYGYPIENYTVTTEDGYILTVYRLPKKNPKGTVFLQHPAITCSTIWVDKKNLSLAFQLFDAGYDVWLANARGDRFSRKHVTLSPDEPQFWDHSFHEMCQYDIPAELELVDNVTKAAPNIVFLGHSLGATDGILYPILHPEGAAKKLKAIISVAPALQFKYVSNQLAPLVLDNWEIVLTFAKFFNQMEILSPLATELYHGLCRDYPPGIELCANAFNWLLGPSYVADQMVPEWYPQIFSQHPSGISVKAFVHYFQCAKAKKFQYYDYGPEENMKRYNSTGPPLYRVEDIQVPIHIVSGDKDNLCTIRDAEETYERIPEKYRFGHAIFHDFNHMDFVYGRKLNEFQQHVLRLVDRVFSVKRGRRKARKSRKKKGA